MPNEKDSNTEINDKSERIVSAVSRISHVLRNGAWQFGTAEGINPVQVDILELLSSRATPVRLSWIATQLSTSLASVSDSVSALVSKGFIEKSKAADDGRAVAIGLTNQGRAMAARVPESVDFARAAIQQLPIQTQNELYSGLLQLIRNLQKMERFPELRTCTSCKYFQVNFHEDKDYPHHCQLVNAPLAASSLRLDCPEHISADSEKQRQTDEVMFSR